MIEENAHSLTKSKKGGVRLIVTRVAGVVILIIFIISLFVLKNDKNIQEKAYISVVDIDLKRTQDCLNVYMQEENVFPDKLKNLGKCDYVDLRDFNYALIEGGLNFKLCSNVLPGMEDIHTKCVNQSPFKK